MQSFTYDSVSSTNDVAKALLIDGAIESVAMVQAAEQTKGKGCRGRVWESQKGAGIYLSVACRAKDWPLVPPHVCTKAAGLACAACLRRATGVPVVVERINDLFVAGRKIGGILTETTVERQRLTAIVVGVGVNVRKCRQRDLALPGLTTSLQDQMDPAAFESLDVHAVSESIAKDVFAAINSEFRPATIG